MKSYFESSGRQADFRIIYSWLPQDEYELPQAPFQHMRSDFLYCGDDPEKEGIWCVYPEFENEKGEMLDEDATVPETGQATMWILSDELRDYHRNRLVLGSKGFLVTGSRKIASVKVVELLALAN